MATWRIDPEWSFEGPGEAGADVEGGSAFALVQTMTGEERQLPVEIAAGGPGVPTSRLRELAPQHLDDASPPRRVVLARDGSIGRIVP